MARHPDSLPNLMRPKATAIGRGVSGEKGGGVRVAGPAMCQIAYEN